MSRSSCLICSAVGIVDAILTILSKTTQRKTAQRLAILLTLAAIGIAWATRPRPEIPARWYEPEDGMAPGEPPTADPRTTMLTTYLRGWQGGQLTYTRVGRGWAQ